MESVAGETLRDEGVRRATDHADAKILRWHDRACELFKRYSLTHKSFMTEDVRLWALTNRLIENPPDQRAWGGVTRWAVYNQVVVCSHYANQKDSKSHCSPKPVWQSLAFPKPKQLNQVEMFV